MPLSRTLAGALLVAVLAAPAALAQQDTNRPAGVPTDIRQVEHADVLDAVALARSLADYGRDRQSAHALLAAAQILIDNPVGTDDERFTGTQQEPDDTKPRGAAEEFSAQALVTAARGMTTDRSLIAAADEMMPRAREASTARARGLTGGPVTITRIVNAHQSLTLHGTFDGGRPARVSIVGDGDTDLDIYIYDENGYLITSGTGWTDRETVAWTPRWTGQFRMVIRNLGPVWNRFVLSTN